MSDKSGSNYQNCPPKADAMIHSLRAFGYDLGMAIADLIDNSIFAGSTDIWINYSWNDSDPWIAIVDNGKGMSEEKLVEAMTLGSTSPLAERDPEDLGRFGLGLKTASFSQCKLVTVSSKTAEGIYATRFWDLDHVEKVKQWMLGITPTPEINELLKPLSELPSGTIVLWKELDRVIDFSSQSRHNPKEEFLNRFIYVKKYLEMIFHQHLENRRKKLNIHVGRGLCIPWDPYMKKNDFRQLLSEEKYEDSRVRVVPYVLPHVSNRSEQENENGAGPKGWNAQQGFYVYRNRRMIVSGGYLDFNLKPEEHYKLARIQVEITNDMDHEWSIDVRKAVASPPERLKGDLLRIAKVTRQRASEVYRARTGARKTRQSKSRINHESAWIKKEFDGKIIYKINTNNAVMKKLIEEASISKSWLNKFCYLIENTLPHRLIIMDGIEHEDCHVNLPDKLCVPPEELKNLCIEIYSNKLKDGLTHEESVDLTCSIEPFDSHPIFRAVLDRIMENN